MRLRESVQDSPLPIEEITWVGKNVQEIYRGGPNEVRAGGITLDLIDFEKVYDSLEVSCFESNFSIGPI